MKSYVQATQNASAYVYRSFQILKSFLLSELAFIELNESIGYLQNIFPENNLSIGDFKTSS